MNDNTHYSIIIPAYNEEKYLPKTLQSIQDAMHSITTTQGEIIVVDNASTDNTKSVALSYGAKVIDEPFRQISRVRNTGAQHANSNILIFIDADTPIENHILTAILTALEEDDIIAGSFLIKPDTKLSWSGNLLFWGCNWFAKYFKFFTGSLIFCRKEDFFNINGFDESYYATEDIEFSRTIKKYAKNNGKTITIIPIKINCNTRKMADYPIHFSFVFSFIFYAVFNNKRFKNKDNCDGWYHWKGKK